MNAVKYVKDKDTREIRALSAELDAARAALRLASEALEANRANYLRISETFSFCGGCGERADHCAADFGFESAGNSTAIQHSPKCPMALHWAAAEAIDAAMKEKP